MNINRDNYESHFIDYLDGRLTPQEVSALHVFLLLNDDLSELLEDTDRMKLTVPKLKYPHKDSLKKDSLHGSPDYYAIAAVEKCLTEEDSYFISKHTDYLISEPIYRKLKLKPDVTIQYPKKKHLYRKDHRIIFLRSAVAAVILLLGGSSYIYFNHTTPPVLAQAEKAMIIPPLSNIENIDILNIKLNNSTITSNNSHLTSPAIIPIPIEAEKENLPIMEPICQITQQIPSPDKDYSLASSQQIRATVNEPEIYLAEAASNWKSSENRILSDNIITSMIEAGKVIAEKIRNKEFYE